MSCCLYNIKYGTYYIKIFIALQKLINRPLLGFYEKQFYFTFSLLDRNALIIFVSKFQFYTEINSHNQKIQHNLLKNEHSSKEISYVWIGGVLMKQIKIPMLAYNKGKKYLYCKWLILSPVPTHLIRLENTFSSVQYTQIIQLLFILFLSDSLQ